MGHPWGIKRKNALFYESLLRDESGDSLNKRVKTYRAR
jgi:hypothetical protein